MKKKINILFLLLIIFCVVGVTYAYYSYSKSFDNNFKVGNFDVVIKEVFEENLCIGNSYDAENERDCSQRNANKEVFVVNNENTDAIVRISYNEYYNSDEFNGYTEAINVIDDYYNESLVSKNWTPEFLNDWFYYNGWYYYNKVLSSGETIKVLNGVSVRCCVVGEYNLDFNLEAIQASQDAVNELWDKNVVINSDGTLVWDFETIIAPI